MHNFVLITSIDEIKLKENLKKNNKAINCASMTKTRVKKFHIFYKPYPIKLHRQYLQKDFRLLIIFLFLS
jgi:hypothetical protein